LSNQGTFTDAVSEVNRRLLFSIAFPLGNWNQLNQFSINQDFPNVLEIYSNSISVN